MQLVLQVEQVGIGANRLKLAATGTTGKTSDLNRAAINPRYLMREMVGF